MADNDKQVNFISEGRSLAYQYREIVGKLQSYSERWGALYSTLVIEDDFVGTNQAVIPSGTPATRLASLTSAISNFDSIITAFDAGIDTNLERISS